MATDPDPGQAPDADNAPTLADLETAILRAEPELDAIGVAEAAGVDLDRARRLWRALGFPERGAAVAFTREDARALTLIEDLVSSGGLHPDLAVGITRAVGQTISRLADWEVATLVRHIEDLVEKPDFQGTRTGAALELAESVADTFEELLVFAWRRHLAAAAVRAGVAVEDEVNTVRVTVGFADIVSFTALSNDMSRSRIGDLVEVFESRSADVVAAEGGRVIKSIGDSILFVNKEPIRAMATAEGIVQVIGRDDRLPDVRVGMATGSVVLRMGDVFGPPVNLASRLTAVARRNRIISDAATAELLPRDLYATQRLPARPIRGFGVLEPVAVRRHRM